MGMWWRGEDAEEKLETTKMASEGHHGINTVKVLTKLCSLSTPGGESSGEEPLVMETRYVIMKKQEAKSLHSSSQLSFQR